MVKGREVARKKGDFEIAIGGSETRTEGEEMVHDEGEGAGLLGGVGKVFWSLLRSYDSRPSAVLAITEGIWTRMARNVVKRYV